MAKKQTRRAVSLNRDVYVAASKHAFRKGVTLSQLTTEAYRAIGVTIPDVHHVPREIAEHAAEAIRHGIVRREEKRAERARIGTVRSPRVVESYLRIRHDGPIRKALGDAHADVCGEPHWHEKVPQPSTRSVRAS